MDSSDIFDTASQEGEEEYEEELSAAEVLTCQPKLKCCWISNMGNGDDSHEILLQWTMDGPVLGLNLDVYCSRCWPS